MVHRAIANILAIVGLGVVSAAVWVWLFYGMRSSAWWRREYVYAALGAVILGGVVLSYRRAREARSAVQALAHTGVTLLGCAGIATVAYFLAAWVGPELLR